MKYPDIVILNDMHPSDFPGAATIAFNHAKFVSNEFNVEFWHTSNVRIAPYVNQKLRIRSFYRNTKIDEFLKSFTGTRIVNEFFPSFIFFRILVLLLIMRPKVVWINQIGVRIPRTIVVWLKFFRIITIQTYHDFGVISPRKLYPANLNGYTSPLLSTNKLINGIYSMRRKYIVKLANLNLINVCISKIQSDIYKDFGVLNIIQIPNGIENCTCKIDESFKKVPNTVFFAGRSTGKGFEKICELIKMNPSWKLVAAGNSELNEIGSKYLEKSQFRYLGFLGPKEVFKQIHISDFVSVLSDCFDVYPTIALETFMHNSIPISSLSTGIVQLIKETGCGIIVDGSIQVLNLNDLKASISQQPKFPVERIELGTSADSYIKVLHSAINHTDYELS